MSMTPERLRRMREVWLVDEPTSFEVAAAFQRFEHAPKRREFPWLWGAMGMAAGLLLMLASSTRGPRAAITPEPERLPTTDAPSTPATETPAPPSPAPQNIEAPPPPVIRNLRTVSPTSHPAPPASSAAALATDPRDLRAAERWLAVGRGTEADPVLTGLEERARDKRNQGKTERAKPAVPK